MLCACVQQLFHNSARESHDSLCALNAEPDAAPMSQVIREGRVDVTLQLPASACCVSLLDCRQGDALLGMQDDSGGKDIAYALENGEVQVEPSPPPPLAPSHVNRMQPE